MVHYWRYCKLSILCSSRPGKVNWFVVAALYADWLLIILIIHEISSGCAFKLCVYWDTSTIFTWQECILCEHVLWFLSGPHWRVLRCEKHSKEKICGIFPHRQADHDSHFHTHAFPTEKACFFLRFLECIRLWKHVFWQLNKMITCSWTLIWYLQINIVDSVWSDCNSF